MGLGFPDCPPIPREALELGPVSSAVENVHLDRSRMAFARHEPTFRQRYNVLRYLINSPFRAFESAFPYRIVPRPSNVSSQEIPGSHRRLHPGSTLRADCEKGCSEAAAELEYDIVRHPGFKKGRPQGISKTSNRTLNRSDNLSPAGFSFGANGEGGGRFKSALTSIGTTDCASHPNTLERWDQSPLKRKLFPCRSAPPSGPR